jgi:peroxiredoxin
MPTSFIIDKEGLIRHVHFGYNKKDPKKWIAEVDALLGKTPGGTDKNEEAQ